MAIVVIAATPAVLEEFMVPGSGQRDMKDTAKPFPFWLPVFSCHLHLNIITIPNYTPGHFALLCCLQGKFGSVSSIIL